METVAPLFVVALLLLAGVHRHRHDRRDRRQRHRLAAGLRPLLEFESASNDPMAVNLAIGLIALIASPEV